jgi:hypothetical protein
MNDLERRFLHHPPTRPAVVHSHDLTRRSYLSLAKILQQQPESRERSIALTKLEESSFWAHAAIARNQVAYPAIEQALAAEAAAAAAPPESPAASPADATRPAPPADRVGSERG